MRVKRVAPSYPLPKGPFVICANHSSFIDIPCIYVLFKKYFVFTGKKEISKWPLFRIFYTSGMNILVDRINKSNATQSLRRMISEIDSGNSVFIFPEGTISKEAPKLSDFKLGAFQLAIMKKVPIVPVTFFTNYKRLERGSFFKSKCSPGICKVQIHAPIETFCLTQKDALQLSIAIKKIIEDPLFIHE